MGKLEAVPYRQCIVFYTMLLQGRPCSWPFTLGSLWMAQLGMQQWAMVDAISIAYVMVSSTRQRRRQATEGDPLDWGIKEREREPIRGDGEARIWTFAGAFSDQFQI